MANQVLLDCRAGRVLPSTPSSPAKASGLAWHATTTGKALSKADVLALKEQGGFPEPQDLIMVRFAPGEDWVLTLRILFSGQDATEREFPVQEAPSRLGEEGVLASGFLFVHGPEELPEDFGFPYVHVIDVTEQNEIGHAPDVEFQTPTAGPAPIKLGEIPVTPPPIVPPIVPPPPPPIVPPPPPPPPVQNRVFKGVLQGMFFETDKCFLLPSAMPSIKKLEELYKELSAEGFDVLVVGHTDSTGSDDYNLFLSVERAEAISAFLQDDVPHWEDRFDAKHGPSKTWGTREDQHMLSVLPDGQPSASSFFKGQPSGFADAATNQAVKDFQAFSNETRGSTLDVDGISGPLTRKELVGAYMAIDQTTLPLSATLFTHGCGEFHPAVDAGDGAAVDENRRAEIFLFELPDGIKPTPQGCAAPGCAEYAEWLAAVNETIDLGS